MFLLTHREREGEGGREAEGPRTLEKPEGGLQGGLKAPPLKKESENSRGPREAQGKPLP